MSAISAYFGIEERGSTLRTEVIAGVTTFMTMAYILFVNPSILGAAGLEFPQVLTVTALSAGVMTIAMGVVAKYPFAIAPGLGLNAVVAFTLVGAQGLTAAEAMGVIVTEGLIITLLVLAGIREAVLNAIPMVLKKAIGAGIGLFIAIIGFVNAGLTISGGAIITRGDTGSAQVAVFIGGLVLALVLLARKVKGALLISIVAATIGGILVNEVFFSGDLWAETGPGVGVFPSDIVAMPDFSLVGDFSFGYVAKLGVLSAILAVFTLMLADFFDTVGTAIGLADEAGFLDDDGKLPGMNRVLLVDSLAATAGGAASASSATTYIESASGISEGGRTGLASVVTGVLFLLALFISPLAGVIPPQATASALVVVGFLMMSAVKDIDWTDVTASAPAFLTLVGMPFTYSITDGIGLGFVSYALLKTFTGRARDVHPMMWVSAAAFLIYFAIEPIRNLLGV